MKTTKIVYNPGTPRELKSTYIEYDEREALARTMFDDQIDIGYSIKCAIARVRPNFRDLTPEFWDHLR